MSLQSSDLAVILRRYPFPAACLIVTLLCGGGSWYLWGQNAELTLVNQDRAKEGEAMLATLVGGSTQRQELATAREITHRIETNLLSDALAENYWYFYKIEEQTKVKMPDMHQLNTPPTDGSAGFRRVPYVIKVTGGFEQVAAFLLAIEVGPRLAKITSFNFSRNGQVITLDMNLDFLGKK